MTPRHPLGRRARLSKLQAMSASELLHRAQYRAMIGVERWQHRSQRLTRPDRLRGALSQTLRTRDWEACLIASRLANRSRFFPSVGEQTWMRRLFETTYERERSETTRHAANAGGHRFEFFGRQFEYGDTIAWQADPITGRAWPSLYHVDVPVHAGDIGYGDVKYVWELNRQQFLIDLGKAWFLTENPEDLEAIRRLVRSWIAGNPYATGVNWSCALEPAFRARLPTAAASAPDAKRAH